LTALSYLITVAAKVPLNNTLDASRVDPARARAGSRRVGALERRADAGLDGCVRPPGLGLGELMVPVS
jgi:hypothetical protein